MLSGNTLKKKAISEIRIIQYAEDFYSIKQTNKRVTSLSVIKKQFIKVKRKLVISMLLILAFICQSIIQYDAR